MLSQTAASGVIVWQLNDIGVAGRTAEQIIDDYQWLIAMTHDAGLLVFCPTWPPGSQNLRGEPTNERDKVNVWLRESGACDGVVDWGAVLEHPIARFTYKPQYQFDTIHFNAAGHRAIAEATPISWFTLTPP